MICCITAIVASCKKDFLDAKPNTSLLLLKTVADCQKLLSNETVLGLTGAMPLAASDEYIVPDYATYQSFTTLVTKNAYIWKKDLYDGEFKIQDWNVPYAAVFYANSVLDALPDMEEVGSSEWKRTKGWALFARAYAFYDLAQNFCNTYDVHTAATDKGIPLRLKPGIDELKPRSTLEATYNQILTDLEQSKRLLTNSLSTNFRNEPSKTAVYAFFARIYLSMRDYTKAELYADSSLMMYNKLIDYNMVSATVSLPFKSLNDETIYQSRQIDDHQQVTTNNTGKYAITNEILNSYQPNDLRRAIFFRTHANGNVFMKGTYSARASLFTGLANDEIYLIKAECAARRSEKGTALDFLNALLINRYKSGTFTPLTASTPQEALAIILSERKKELIRRGLRWSDLKRLNKEGANITLTRVLNEQTYTLLPNDPRYIFPIPDDEIAYSKIDQNNR